MSDHTDQPSACIWDTCRTSEQTDSLMTALAEAQCVMLTATKDAKNPHFRSSYATLASVREALLPANERGIAVVQLPHGRRLLTRIAKGEQWIEFSTPILSASDGPQPYGSALTYARRYALMSVFGIAPDDDDDGNAAQAAHQSAPPRRAPPPSNGNTRAQQSKPGGPSDAQLKRLFAISREHGVEQDAIKQYLAATWGLSSTRELSRDQYNALCEEVIPNLSGPHPNADPDDDVPF